jgi:hypothetical protein
VGAVVGVVGEGVEGEGVVRVVVVVVVGLTGVVVEGGRRALARTASALAVADWGAVCGATTGGRLAATRNTVASSNCITCP